MFNVSDESMGLAPLSHIKESLDTIFGAGEWLDWELETFSFELKLILDELTRDKINLLQAMLTDPDLFYSDMTFFLHAVDVMNNKVADFERLPMPTSLELAYAIEESKSLAVTQHGFGDPKSDIVQTVAYLLREEGYSEPVYPFTFIPPTLLAAGQTPDDTEAKKIAITKYIEDMGGL